ncbi:MAG: Ig-like domain-containing protein [Kofleriaceae bacterium]|nr:Ig-like domain-containing protein [Kofleriaceae bacterium]
MQRWFGIVLVLTTAACGDNQSGDTDLVPPAVLVSTPTAGSTAVAPTSAIGIAFTERVVADAGSISVGGTAVDLATVAWDAGHQRFTVTPAMPFAPEATIEVVVDGFADEAGNVMTGAYRFSFAIAASAERPRVVAVTPNDGAQNVGVALDAITVTFDQPMDPNAGSTTLFGLGTLAAVEWTSPTQARIPVRGLRGETPYIVALDAFRNVDGLPLDPEPVLGNGRLEFHTGLDDVAPVVVSSVPAEGATNVEVGDLREVAVVFAEPMRTSSGTAILSGLGDPVELAVTWSEDAHRATLVLPEEWALIYDTAYTLELSGFMDVHGNALAAEPYLVNGCLDFAAGADTKRPRFLSSTIADGAMGVATADRRYYQYDILLEVSELVDVSNATATVEVDGETFDSVYVYAARYGRTVQVAAVGAARPLRYGATYAVKLTGVTDLAGNEIDSAGYLGDGQLDFTTGADTIAPFVAQLSGLVEGSGSLSPWGTQYVQVTFSEPIDDATAAIELVHFGSGGTTELEPPTVDWLSDMEITISFPTAGLTADQRYGLRFVGIVDLEGNALDPVPLLGDGTLDFSVGAARPLRSTPPPGIVDMYPYELYRSTNPGFPGIRQRSTIELQFTEPMDTSLDTVQLVDETDPSAPTTQTVQGTWSQDGTTLSFVLAEETGYEPLQGEHHYVVRFAHLRGADGLAVDAGATHYSGAALRFRTQPTNPQLDHTCIHLLYDTCEQVDAFAMSLPWAPTTDQAHSYFEVTLPPADEGGYLGYTSVFGDDETDLLLYLRETMSLSIRDIDAAFDVPLLSVAAPPACPVITGSPGCGQPGEVGVTRIVRARMPFNGTYIARWASEHEVVHFITERAGAF